VGQCGRQTIFSVTAIDVTIKCGIVIQRSGHRVVGPVGHALDQLTAGQAKVRSQPFHREKACAAYSKTPLASACVNWTRSPFEKGSHIRRSGRCCRPRKLTPCPRKLTPCLCKLTPCLCKLTTKPLALLLQSIMHIGRRRYIFRYRNGFFGAMASTPCRLAFGV
jgi:hypothetical protein